MDRQVVSHRLLPASAVHSPQPTTQPSPTNQLARRNPYYPVPYIRVIAQSPTPESLPRGSLPIPYTQVFLQSSLIPQFRVITQHTQPQQPRTQPQSARRPAPTAESLAHKCAADPPHRSPWLVQKPDCLPYRSPSGRRRPPTTPESTGSSSTPHRPSTTPESGGRCLHRVACLPHRSPLLAQKPWNWLAAHSVYPGHWLVISIASFLGRSKHTATLSGHHTLL